MAKRSSDGDVLFNLASVAQANKRRLLATWLGPDTESGPQDGKAKVVEEQEELEDAAWGYENIGVGGVIPKNIKDGSFTRRTLTSNDKLLQNLIGRKAAKAHISAKQLKKEPVQQQKFGKPTISKVDESEDEEEGRAAAFKSKRRKTAKKPSIPIDTEDPEDGDDATAMDTGQDTEENILPEPSLQKPSPDTGGDSYEEPKDSYQQSKRKTGSYLDEILAERAKKKKKNENKSKSKGEDANA
ncbi:hypothetical protein P154DRAFT_466620 [Amniculicola lignicola CBS 123094]|uniref:Uncharacterized protein n=1 Tax=Amniculicola lignicola CBS 123094 TaxID=1392246 RepID=A0A6A5WG58_9PLEO|nr:hypothetical protein P154DRAFT_466620 [Amniculicola lignicola CBS 123094]